MRQSDFPEATDVIVRAYRGIGLQLLINQDMRMAFSAYPRHPDPNIDHRRVPNLMVYFGRHGQVRANRMKNGRPLVIHNIGAGAKVEDVLFSFEITGCLGNRRLWV